MARLLPLVLVALFLAIMGCSSAGNPVEPVDGQIPARVSDTGTAHSMWGMWQGVIDPENETVQFARMRDAEMHLNALPFLEPPALLNLTLDGLEFNGNELTADIGLRHPFLGLNQFTGFDVCGIFISDGSMSGFADSDIVMAGEGETRLLNADAYSRFWNPTEFPVGGMFGYNDGLLGAPDSVGNYSATLNSYKYFCDDLQFATDTLQDVTLESRGMFSAGQKNIRRYLIDITGGLVFNYAIDACWKFPTGNPPYTVPNDFGEAANRVEAWRVDVTETNNTLWNDGETLGGSLQLSIDVYDWFNAQLNSVRVESPGNFDMVETSVPFGGGEGFSTYQVDIVDATPAEGQINLLISVESEQANFGGYINGTYTTSYFMHTSDVASETTSDPLKNIPLRLGVQAYDVGVEADTGDALILYSDGQVWRHTSVDDYYTGELFISIDSLFFPDYKPQRMDVNALGVSTYAYTKPDNTDCWKWVYDAGGNKLHEQTVINACPNYRKFPDVSAFVGQGTYANHLCHFAGGYYTATSGDPHDRQWWYILGPPNYNSWDPPNGKFCTLAAATGLNQLDYDVVQAIAADQGGAHLWIMEKGTENIVSRWTTGASIGMIFADDYFPSTEDISNWYDPVDLSRDSDNRLLVLDENFGQGIISVWNGSDTGGTYHGFTGDEYTITEEPRAIDGSDFDGSVFVIHGDTYDSTHGYFLSIFTSDELP